MSSIALRTVNARGKLRVDKDAGEIYGVPVISGGMTLPSGGGRAPFRVDDQTLDQVAAAINASPAGVKMRVTHPGTYTPGSFEPDDVGMRLAYCTRARVVGGRVLADVEFLDAQDPAARRLMAMAERDPAGLGLSIVIEETLFENESLRVQTIAAVDFVGTPAANPNGMLSASGKEPPMNYSPAQIEFLTSLGLPEGADEDAIAAFVDGLDETQAADLVAVASTPAPGPDAPDAVAASAQLAGERERVNGVLLAAQAGNLTLAEANAFASNPAVTSAVVLQHLRTEKAKNERPLAMNVSVGQDLGRNSLAPAITGALSLRLGSAPAKLHPRVDEFRGRSLIEMGRAWLSGAGVQNAATMRPAQVATAVMRPGSVALSQSTSDFPALLADALSKSLSNGYVEYPTTWARWAGRRTAPDFKPLKVASLHGLPTPKEIAEGGEYEYVSLSETGAAYALKTYGVATMLTRQALINDDLSAFERLPQMASGACRRLEDDLAYAPLVGNATVDEDGTPLFSQAHKNIGAGELSVEALSAGRVAMATQRDLTGSVLNLRPSYLLVPVVLEDRARQLISSTEIMQTSPAGSTDAASSEYAVNAPDFLRSLEVVSDPRLDANSVDEWYLAASPRLVDTVELGFLEGEEAPVVEEQVDFDTDGRKIKVRHNAAAAALDFRGLYRSSGI